MKKTTIMKVTKVVTKIVEVFHWVGAAILLCATVCSLAAPSLVKYFVGLDVKPYGTELNIYGFEVTAPVINGVTDMKTFFVFGIGGILILCLMAMIFRNMNLIIKKSEESTPFQPDNIRMIREIGIFAIAIPVVGLIMSIICRLVLGGEVETSVNFYSVVVGIIMICLTQFFIHGAELEEDVEGLV